MRKKLIKRLYGVGGFVAAFLILAVSFSMVSTYILREFSGLSVENQINQQFDDVAKQEYSCLIFGNSRLYRGVDPEYLSNRTYNFAHDNDCYNQIYWKLVYLEQHDIDFDTAIIGTDYFMYSFLETTRNEFYKKHLPHGYMLDFVSDSSQKKQGNSKRWDEQLNDDLNNYIINKFQYPFNYMLAYLKELVFSNDEMAYLKDNGQFIIPYLKATDADTVERDMTRLDIQADYFEKTLSYCKEKGKRVVIVMPPTRDVELDNYTAEQLSEFNHYLEEMATKYDAVFINYAFDEKYKATNLYMDVTHLTPAAAISWTKQLNKDLQDNGIF